ncbi:MAG: bifunctional diaminohydroxyphosphoribosylaminopyrimidine deaminase/5-amino-6-(5-phosphoribosylamino)uracil reductase RibD, partial [Alphaproteobacteria bacterium]|nr:bifunctional diaminohydroxyphosphoribosylaminopyrimidine deaminase/5-amino-6-(5-phosphoribosylamino)uracil reductase RibD [Alphaproteobacteria bacterium]
ALVTAGVRRVVMAITDPDPRVSGRGAARLREHGIAVTAGVLEREARALNAGFFSRILRGRPLVTLKLATTLDGRIATCAGESQWITGEAARNHGHRLRAEHDAIMVGIGTALADDPSLTCRLSGLASRSPIRVVVDSSLRLPVDSLLVMGASRVLPLWIVTVEKTGGAARPPNPQLLLNRGGAGEAVPPPVFLSVKADDTGRVDLPAALQALAQEGITRVLVEGGGTLAAALLRLDLVDRVVWFRAPMVLGGDALAAVGTLGLDRLADAASFNRLSVTAVGNDIMEIYEKPWS